MTELEALLSGVRANPDDVTARLVLADWLEEHGEPDRAEIIRLQVRLSHFPGRPHSRREIELLTAHESEWLGTAIKRDTATRAHIRLGLVHVEYLSGSAVASDADFELDRWFGTGWVEEVRIRDEYTLQTLAPRSYLASVPRLCVDIAGEEVSEGCVRQSFDSPSLASVHSLELCATHNLGLLVRVLLDSPLMPRLRALSLWGRLEREELDALASWPSSGLTALKFRYVSMDGERLLTLLQSPICAGLDTLDLESCKLGPEGARVLARSPVFNRLRSLSLSDNPITDAGIEAITCSHNPPRIARLDLSACEITDVGMEALAAWSGLASVGTLQFSGRNGFGEAGVRALATSSHLGNLHGLWLSGPRITDAAVAVLAATPQLTDLKWLVVNGLIGAAGGRALAVSPHLSRLEWLGILSSQLTTDTMWDLVDSPQLANLEYLEFRHGDVEGPSERAVWRDRLGQGRRLSELTTALTSHSPGGVVIVQKLGEQLGAELDAEYREILKPARRTLIDALDTHPDAQVRVAAARVLEDDLRWRVDWERNEAYDPILIEALFESFSRPISTSPLTSLRYEPEPEVALCPVIFRCLDHDDAGVRIAAWNLFEFIAHGPVEDIHEIRRCVILVLCSARYADIRSRAADALGGIIDRREAPDAEAIADVARLLGHEADAEARKPLLGCLRAGVRWIGKWEWCPNFANLMDSPHADVRQEVVDLLGDLGCAGDASVWPVITRALSDPDEIVRSVAAAAIRCCAREWPARLPGNVDLVGALARQLHNPPSRTRVAVVGALGSLRSRTADVVPLLTTCLSDADIQVRREAGVALLGFGRSAPDAVPELLQLAVGMLSDSSPEARAAAAAAVGSCGAAAGAFAPRLVDLLCDPHDSVRRSAAAAFWDLGPAAAPAAAALANAYRSSWARLALAGVDPDPLAALDRNHPEAVRELLLGNPWRTIHLLSVAFAIPASELGPFVFRLASLRGKRTGPDKPASARGE